MWGKIGLFFVGNLVEGRMTCEGLILLVGVVGVLVCGCGDAVDM